MDHSKQNSEVVWFSSDVGKTTSEVVETERYPSSEFSFFRVPFRRKKWWPYARVTTLCPCIFPSLPSPGGQQPSVSTTYGERNRCLFARKKGRRRKRGVKAFWGLPSPISGCLSGIYPSGEGVKDKNTDYCRGVRAHAWVPKRISRLDFETDDALVAAAVEEGQLVE